LYGVFTCNLQVIKTLIFRKCNRSRPRTTVFIYTSWISRIFKFNFRFLNIRNHLQTVRYIKRKNIHASLNKFLNTMLIVLHSQLNTNFARKVLPTMFSPSVTGRHYEEKQSKQNGWEKLKNKEDVSGKYSHTFSCFTWCSTKRNARM